MRRETILITGAGGRVARMLRCRLARPGRTLRLLDPAELTAEPGEVVFTGSVTDAALMARAAAGCDAILHLGGLPGEAPWAALAEVNVEGTRTVLEAARLAGVPRVLLASSAHVAGFYRRPGAIPRPRGVTGPADPLPADAPARPDTLYGVSKAAAEALGSLYADRFGLAVYALRLGDCAPEPPGEWALHSWLSPGDAARLVEACLSSALIGYQVVWGISRNARRWWSLTEGERIGYHPADDAEEYAGAIAAAHGDRATTLGLAGGRSAVAPLGERRR
ncbi:NAD-dependent epimerase/dehydratase family protein [Spirilliplanes yamanashiensis]|uniref:NAD-dependent dehydratase n=1 Tax=Spirilliplanes yamanashiensis TaxID=42233 RepID=A0A8J4DMD0_9ACTN|nr:NAD(P)-dependent oxidoreductase [Spirilliplanes yamanashiensis]MDP9816518.1 nucleoside-diphosphate-sugar epimerase [Spirilliplanes yamanashiensis]GIJ06045.1 NAD-dependent dehydratase [Spirilliplanes yamanashiensis]